MSDSAHAVFALIARSKEEADEQRNVVGRIYAEAVLSGPATEEAGHRILGAMKAMGIGTEELSSDVRTLRRIREIEERLAGAREISAKAEAVFRAARADLQRARSRLHIPSIEIFHRRAEEASDHATDCAAEFRRWVEQLQAERAAAPRLFQSHKFSHSKG